MKGDFTRSSYDVKKRYTSVRMQQGRVQLDSDWNEYADIIDRRIEAPLGDLLGSFAAPATSAAAESGFAITLASPPEGDKSLPFDLTIGVGHCYVDGILCENDIPCTYSSQTHSDFAGVAFPQGDANTVPSRYIAYLDVWQQLVTCLEDPNIREVALDGADTAARTKTEWQVQLLPLPGQSPAAAEANGAGSEPFHEGVWQEFVNGRSRQRGKLTAQQKANTRVVENQLCRVEVHSIEDNGFACKMSCENGSVAYRFGAQEELLGEAAAQAGETFAVQLEETDSSRVYLERWDWVELELGDGSSGGNGAPLFQVHAVDDGDGAGVVVLLGGRWPAGKASAKGGILRRWDQKAANLPPDGLVHVQLPQDREQSAQYDLGNGLVVSFSAKGTYQVNDYWLIPVRTQVGSGTSGITWLKDQPPHGVEHHYAPLGLVYREADSWKYIPAADSRFSTLPKLTAGLARLTQEVHAIKDTVDKLITRVDNLTSRVDYLEHKILYLGRQLVQEYDSVQHLVEGDLVSIHPYEEGLVVPATKENERRVIGVVVEVVSDPYQEGKVRVGLHGVARCKVTGHISVGDLLVVSESDKHARRAGKFVRPGTVVGKALQSHKPHGEHIYGMVDVMITL